MCLLENEIIVKTLELSSHNVSWESGQTNYTAVNRFLFSTGESRAGGSGYYNYRGGSTISLMSSELFSCVCLLALYSFGSIIL